MSPMQYRTCIRLQEARRRLVADGDDAAEAGFAVGYDSPSQFSRDYRRMFGTPPARDAARLRGDSMAAPAALASGATKRIHILVKPTRPDLTTNLIVNTDRRTYLAELRSTPATYMASVSWDYPEDDLIALHRQDSAADEAASVDAGLDLNALNFRYAIQPVKGGTPPWLPSRAFDDGHKVYIAFPSGIGQGELPPLFVLGADGGPELVNYRVRQNWMIVDRLVVGGVAMIAVAFALGYALESNTPKGPVQTAQDIDARASADGLSALPCARVLWTGNSGISGGWDYDAGRHESCCQFLPYSSILPP